MKDVEIFKNIGIPLQTLQLWKKSDNYRKLLYELVKELPKDYINQVKEKIENENKIDKNFSI
jgi:formate dehydrogenase maturation protein FdhE